MGPDFRGMQLDHARSYLELLVECGLLERIQALQEAHRHEPDPELRLTPEESYPVAFAVAVEELATQIPDDWDKPLGRPPLKSV